MVESIESSDSATGFILNSNVDNFEIEEGVRGHEKELSKAKNQKQLIPLVKIILNKNPTTKRMNYTLCTKNQVAKTFDEKLEPTKIIHKQRPEDKLEQMEIKLKQKSGIDYTFLAKTLSTPPTSIQDLESQLSQLASSGPDRNIQVLASVVLAEVKTLAAKNLSLTTIESWAYAAIVAKMTSNSEYSTGFANLNPSEQTLFKTLTGIDQFQGQFASHSFTTPQVTEIAKTFSDGTISLENANDLKFMQTFYSNLQAGQNPKTAQQNAYITVPYSSLSAPMQTFITGIVNPNPAPPPSFPHTPTSIEDLKSELSQFASQGAPCKTLADAVLQQVTTLQGKSLSLTTIESWAYAAIVSNITTNPAYKTDYDSLSPEQKTTFETLSGLSSFEAKLSSLSFSTDDITAIVNCFSDGTITLQNTTDKKFMETFYSNLQKGEDPETAYENAFSTIPVYSISKELGVYMTALTTKWWEQKVDKAVQDYFSKVNTQVSQAENGVQDCLNKGDISGYSAAMAKLNGPFMESLSDDFYAKFSQDLKKYRIGDDPVGSKLLAAKGVDFQNTIMQPIRDYVQARAGNISQTPIPTNFSDQYPTLNEDGITMYQLHDAQGDWILPKGGFTSGTSEAMAYTMLNAVRRGDSKLYMELLKSYLHFANMSAKGADGKQDPMKRFGLMGWAFTVPPDKDHPPVTPGANYGWNRQGGDCDSASDADEDTIHSLILAADKFKDDPSWKGLILNFNGKDYNVNDYITNTIHAFANQCINDNGLVTMGDSTKNQNNGFPDYIHPDAIVSMMYFLDPTGTGSNQDFSILKNCLKSEMEALTSYAQKNNGWIYNDWPKDGKYEKAFSGEAIRFLWTFPSFLLFCEQNPQFVQGSGLEPTITSATNIIKNLCLNVLRNFQEAGNPQTAGTEQYGPDGLTNNMGVTAPLYFALLVLKKLNVLPPQVEQEVPGVALKAGEQRKTEIVPIEGAITRLKIDYMYNMNYLYTQQALKDSYPGLYFQLQFGVMMRSMIINNHLED